MKINNSVQNPQNFGDFVKIILLILLAGILFSLF